VNSNAAHTAVAITCSLPDQRKDFSVDAAGGRFIIILIR
jgi:hypothetical protein